MVWVHVCVKGAGERAWPWTRRGALSLVSVLVYISGGWSGRRSKGTVLSRCPYFSQQDLGISGGVQGMEGERWGKY